MERKITTIQGESPGSFRALLILNAVLLLVLAAVTFSPAATAQNRARGEYTMVSGGVQGSQSAAVYIADVTNQELIAVTYNINTKVVDGIGYRNLAADASALTRSRARASE